MRHLIYIIIFIFAFVVSAKAQILINGHKYLLEANIQGGDTMPMVYMQPITIFPKKEFKSNREYRRYTRLMYNVKKAYPFSVIARNELKKMNDSLVNIVGDKQRKKYIKSYEKQMFKKYETQLRNLTISQGRILIKLMYREFGNTSYSLVKEYRGGFSAVFWQGIARLFGSNLKQAYDPIGEDADIEYIIMLIENGLL